MVWRFADIGTPDSHAAFRCMAPTDPNQGPLKPRAEKDCVVVENPPNEPLHMSPDEADLSGIRMLDEAGKARDSHEKGRRK